MGVFSLKEKACAFFVGNYLLHQMLKQNCEAAWQTVNGMFPLHLSQSLKDSYPYFEAHIRKFRVQRLKCFVFLVWIKWRETVNQEWKLGGKTQGKSQISAPVTQLVHESLRVPVTISPPPNSQVISIRVTSLLWSGQHKSGMPQQEPKGTGQGRNEQDRLHERGSVAASGSRVVRSSRAARLMLPAQPIFCSFT